MIVNSAFVVDIETVKSPDLEERLGVREKLMRLDGLSLEELNAFAAQEGIKLGNRTKHESILAYVTDHYRKEMDRAALRLYGAEICAIAYAPLSGGDVRKLAVDHRLYEKEMIETVIRAWSLNGPHLMCGFNIRKFDLPVLRARCLVLGITWPSWLPSTARGDLYDTDHVFDCMDILTEGTLDVWLRTFGLPPKTAHGSQVADMTPHERATYCGDDVERERALCQRVISHTKYEYLLRDD